MLASRPRPHPQKQVEKKTVGNIFVKQISEKNINDEKIYVYLLNDEKILGYLLFLKQISKTSMPGIMQRIPIPKWHARYKVIDVICLYSKCLKKNDVWPLYER